MNHRMLKANYNMAHTLTILYAILGGKSGWQEGDRLVVDQNNNWYVVVQEDNLHFTLNYRYEGTNPEELDAVMLILAMRHAAYVHSSYKGE